MKRIMIIGSDYLAPEWTPLELLTDHDTDLLNCAMYVGELETTRGIAHGYKHDKTRRTIYVLEGIAYRYIGLSNEKSELVGWQTPSDALSWWQS
jgi:hypothetical protein